MHAMEHETHVPHWPVLQRAAAMTVPLNRLTGTDGAAEPRQPASAPRTGAIGRPVDLAGVDAPTVRRMDRGRISVMHAARALDWRPESLLVAHFADHHRIVVRTPHPTEAGWIDLDHRYRLVVRDQLRSWLGLGPNSNVMTQVARSPLGGVLVLCPPPSLVNPEETR